ncbi:hypothetical protein PCI56_24645 [Plesiomonas shigelloides subsp. oncorhynchi]|nr:hypothetical protein [Plesiomonas shigelloides]
MARQRAAAVASKSAGKSLAVLSDLPVMDVPVALLGNTLPQAVALRTESDTLLATAGALCGAACGLFG